MSIEIKRNELPGEARASVAQAICFAIGHRKGVWTLDLTSEPAANAWDVEVCGPHNFHWARRFSGEDRDAEVISEAVRSAVVDQAAA
jgi:hypothetical protein